MMLTSQTETSQENGTFEAAAAYDKLPIVMRSNAAHISKTIFKITLVSAIFGASRLNQRATKHSLERIENRLDAGFEAPPTQFRAARERLAQRINALDTRLSQRLDFIEARLAPIERQTALFFKSAPRSR